MPTYLTPGVYVEEVSTSGGIRPVGTSTLGAVGEAPDPEARVNQAVAVNNWTEFVKIYVKDGSVSTPLSNAVFGFFENGGRLCYVVNVGKDQPIVGDGKGRKGLEVLETHDDIALVIAPGRDDPASYDALLTHCEKLLDRVAILDAPDDIDGLDELTRVATVANPAAGAHADPNEPKGRGPRKSAHGYGALYYPYLTIRDPLAPKTYVNTAPSGHVAGIYARTDATRGVFKAPANELCRGALGVTKRITQEEQANLNTNGVNIIRFFQDQGILVWGARTNAPTVEWQYVPVRRLFTMVETAIGRSTRWVVFEPNDPTLWKSIKRDVTMFLKVLWRDGALMGKTPEEAFFVKCDEETNPPEVIEQGMVVTLIGLAPVKPAEFVVFRIGQKAAGTEVQSEG